MELSRKVDEYIETAFGFHYVELGRSALFRIILENTDENIREQLQQSIDERFDYNI